MDEKAILKSVKKTRRLIVLDDGHDFLSIASEIISIVTIKQFDILKISPKKITMPNFPVPTGYSLTKIFIQDIKILLNIAKIFLTRI